MLMVKTLDLATDAYEKKITVDDEELIFAVQCFNKFVILLLFTQKRLGQDFSYMLL